MMNLYHKFTAAQGGVVDYTINLGGFWTTGSFLETAKAAADHGVVADPSGQYVIIGTQNNTSIRQYNLSTPWVASSGSYTGLEKADHDQGESDLSHWGPGNDGTRLLMGGPDRFRLLTLATPYQINSVATHSTITHNSTAYHGICGGHDGTYFYVGYSDKYVDQWNCPVPYSLSGATYTKRKTVTSMGNNVLGLNLSPDGVHFLYTGNSGNFDIGYYKLSTPGDIATAVFQKEWNVSSTEVTQGMYYDWNTRRGFRQVYRGANPDGILDLTYTPPA
jgi:WD40 repeat protein